MKIKRTEKLRQVIKNASNLGNVRIEAGWIHPGEKHADTKLTMAQLAQVMEYGAVIGKKTHIPPRPMLRMTGKLKVKEWVKEAAERTKDVLNGKQKDSDAYESLGALIADDIKGTMSNSALYAPNAPSTVKKKGKNTPLLDTLVLRGAVDYRSTKK
ncbi:MAG: hypothetical protein Q4P84_00090 [Elusimicrobiales bacterium]|nr:hypothetical protein [Elusimicrobiales bacterium]